MVSILQWHFLAFHWDFVLIFYMQFYFTEIM